MIGASIHVDALAHLVGVNAVRELIVGHDATVSVRTRANLTAVGKFADHLGLKGFAVEL